MDEDVLVKECLSESKLKNGKDLLDKLEASGIGIEAAYWVYMYETIIGDSTLLRQRWTDLVGLKRIRPFKRLPERFPSASD
jgi:hypothetical protein